MLTFSVGTLKKPKTMKKLLIYAALPVCMLATLPSCSTNSITHAPVTADTDDSKANSTACYVQLNDGTVKHYKTLKLVTSPFGTPYLLADRKTRYKASEMHTRTKITMQFRNELLFRAAKRMWLQKHYRVLQ
jgi:hypothetical protein